MQINGVAHTFITAGDFAAARAFYGQLLPFLGLRVRPETSGRIAEFSEHEAD